MKYNDIYTVNQWKMKKTVKIHSDRQRITISCDMRQASQSVRPSLRLSVSVSPSVHPSISVSQSVNQSIIPQ